MYVCVLHRRGVFAQDYMLAYALRKYAGVRSYVVPMDLTDSDTWGNTDVDWGMQHQVLSRQLANGELGGGGSFIPYE